MRKITNINNGWEFDLNGVKSAVDIPHSWNGIDGQDGGDDYVRTVAIYTKELGKIEIAPGEQVYLEFKGVNSSAKVILNEQEAGTHDGGYSKFRVNITDYLNDTNKLVVEVDNRYSDKVYPQKADFTFYGGIYRDVNLIIVSADHFDLDYHGGPGIAVTPIVKDGKGTVKVEAYTKSEGDVSIEIKDADGELIATGKNNEEIVVETPHLWNGLEDPYLYTATATLTVNGEVTDQLCSNFGFRFFDITNKGFFLNGKSYPLRGVCRHQDRPKVGNAITKEMHEEDMEIIRDIGANTIRLAHYQHDDYFYDLCDKYGLVVWAEIPYISMHLEGGDDNARSQMTELIVQQYNHPSIVVWGISNEITMFKNNKKEKLALHKELNELCHKLDPTRKTTIAAFAMTTPFNKLNHVSDVASWNLYFGWYVPFFFMNELWFGFFRLLYPKYVIGLSEYGAEAMTNFHSPKPKIGDNSEEYQCKYHEYLAKFIKKTKYLWATHVWNMFDFGSDGRNQGGEPGMNHKGLVTFDRKIKKDSFYIYKASWSKEPFVHIAGKRYANRTGNKFILNVYSNQKEIELYVNGAFVEKKSCDVKAQFKIPFKGDLDIEIKSGELSDTAHFCKVAVEDENYKLKVKSNSHSWEKKSD